MKRLASILLVVLLTVSVQCGGASPTPTPSGGAAATPVPVMATPTHTPAPPTMTPTVGQRVKAEVERLLKDVQPKTTLRGEGVKIAGRELIILTALDRSGGLETLYEALGAIHGAVAKVRPDVDVVTIHDVTGQKIVVEMRHILAFYEERMSWGDYVNTWKITDP